ncbi:MAG TPA: type III-A CRISPR-associated protein Csm2 [Syntrophales bacterium]|nr:type III-A CRISPR-associated protein Csm2 [Syntrophales bacterium]HOM08303.1 type III-A CRISPR-associated protein Csm2 [Syntrophales bacterium]HOO00940.1 type III-A CRISPR-associated protein Csm2 [Syntrophales bacterium]HPC02056.1 type III-A CRISPR-associated protein Csm2 [Syntrophales bacterium]
MEKITFYKDPAKRLVRPTLFSDVAENLARDIAKEGGKVQEKDRLNKNKRSQIRKFYDEVLRLKSEAETEPWENVEPLVKMLNAKAAYAFGRDYVSAGFLSFIKESVGQVNSPQDLNVFANLFEAFMGYYKMYGD